MHKVKRGGIPVSKDKVMLGSYGPKAEAQIAKTKPDSMPSGMMARGHYVVNR